MKPIIFVSLLLGAALGGCAQQHAVQSDYVPAQGGPGYGAGGANTVPGDRPAAGGALPQGSSGAGVTGSGGAYGTGESGSTGASTGAQGASSSAGATSGGPDKQSMCALQQRLDAAKSEPERRAIIDEAMPGMTPDLRQQHLEMLRQQCH